jgi:uncharacterized membrane protein
MGFIFGLLGAIAGMWFMSGGRAFFGFLAGMMIGWLLHRVLHAQTTIRRLVDRVDNLEQRNAATAPIEKVAKKSFDTPERVSIYEPPPVVAPPATPPPPESPSLPPFESAPDADVHAHKPMPEPSMGQHTIDVTRRWLTTGNVPVKVGVIISFFGVAFLLKYAVEQELFSIPMSVRYLAVAGFATFLLWFGWRKRIDNRVFALSIQGGGIGVLFLTVFAALRLHELLSPAAAFTFLVLITAASGVLAIKQESRAFAILGTTGGFLAPLLVSTGAGNHVGLFSYYLILNCAILGVAWYRPWRELNIIGFGFTFVVGTIWGYQYYVPELFATTEPFLVLYSLFYTIIAVLFAFRQRPELRGYVDGTLLFGTPTIAFALQTQLLNDTEYGLAISAAVVAAFYAAMALWLRRTQEKNFELLTQAFVALAVAFGTIAIPLALDDRWTAIAWAMEGAALVWIGVRQTTTLARMTGAALAFAGGAEFMSYGWVDGLGIPVFNGNFIGGVLIALTSLYSSYMLLKDERGREWQKLASVGLLVWGLMWWFGAGSAEIFDRVWGNYQLHALLLFGTMSLSAIAYAGKRFDWVAYARVSLALLPALFVGALAYLLEHDHFFKGLGTLGWLVAIAAHIWILHCYGDKENRAAMTAHGWGVIFFTGLLALEAAWQIERVVYNDVWSGSAALLIVALAAFALLYERRNYHGNRRWPFSTHSDAYFVAALLMAVAFTMLVIGVCINDPGDPAPLPYIPLLNPLDVLSIIAVMLTWYALKLEQQSERWKLGENSRAPQIFLGSIALLLSTIAVVRIVHHITGVVWNPDALMNSVGVQSTLSIYWAILGLSGMVLGTKRARRSVWMVGAGLMVIVVLKLFAIDLGNTGTVARIVSFLGVGVMLLVVGYFSPVPPKQPDSSTA